MAKAWRCLRWIAIASAVVAVTAACSPATSTTATSVGGQVEAIPDDAFGSTFIGRFFGVGEEYSSDFFDAVGRVSFRDTGFTVVGCSVDDGLEFFRQEARRTGATTFRLVRASPPDFWSTCFRGEAELLVRNQRQWPTIPTSDADARAYLDGEGESLDPIEGIWLEAQGRDRLLIQRLADGSFVAITLSSPHPLWHPGMIRAELQPTQGLVYPGSAWTPWFSGHSTTFVLDPSGMSLSFTMTINDGIFRYVPESVTSTYLRQYPEARFGSEPSDAPATEAQVAFGSGVLLTSDGVIGTAAHVVAGEEWVAVAIDGVQYEAAVLAVDATNDVALLRAEGFSADFDMQPIGDDSVVRLGERVATVGFPMAVRLGERPTYTEGTVSSLSAGFVDDARLLQVSAPIQPGNSGGPLFNYRGEVVGIVMATLDPLWSIQNRGAIPQNMNFAVRVSYLTNLARIRGVQLELDQATGDTELAGTALAELGSRVAVQVLREHGQ